MSKKIVVTSPFYVSFEKGDEFTLTDNGYSFNVSSCEDDKQKGEVRLSPEYVEYLKSIDCVDEKKEFVNVFDEIDTLVEKYEKQLEDAKKVPFNREEKTVLANMLLVLNHLKDLKK